MPITKEALPELVLLMRETLVVDAAFMQSAYQVVLGLKLDSDTEFVTGQFPFFGFQSGGVLVSVTIGNAKYGAAEYRELFPHHNLSEVQSSLGFFARRRLARHQGWIGACLLREQQPSGLDPYVHIGRALCPFALPHTAVGLVDPKLGRAALFSKELPQLLRAGDMRQLFGV